MRSRGEEAIRDAVVNAAEAEDDGKGAGSRDLRLAHKPLNDLGNSERLETRSGRDLLFAREIGRHSWSGKHWSARSGDKEWALRAQKTAHAMLRLELAELRAEAAETGDKKAVADYWKWAVTSGNATRLEAMQDLLEPRREKAVDELNADPFLFNVQNGTLELGNKSDPTAVRLRRHARLDYITRLAPIGYDPEATCPRFCGFLDQILPDREVQLWLQRWFGYHLTGDFSEHKLAVHWGEGRNGKGVLTKLVQWILGDYGAIVQFQSFVDAGQRRGGEPSPDLAKLVGARGVFASEAKKGARLDDGLIKQLTGGDSATVRKLNRDFFDLAPTFKINLIANNRPQVRDDTYGMWSRVMLVPFTVTIRQEEIDTALLDKLKAEGPGVLNWLLDGFRMWREEGLSPPEAISAATAEYRKESDVIGQFLEAATIREPGARIRASDLYACYQGWCENNELRPVKQGSFGRELSRRQITPSKDGIVYRVGIKWSGMIDWDWMPAA